MGDELGRIVNGSEMSGQKRRISIYIEVGKTDVFLNSYTVFTLSKSTCLNTLAYVPRT